ncbi:MarR family transcriptional regulator [Sphingomonas morindae]|uniref:MarR family transcriptional regulator n=1 Tax=Sphingomonas morindae TaxID=1541170 RepID=A0ABY4X9X9_9SPHN|nr:MarR family transcriptional regulator [Sphingomonas morindae]USI73771.1 MarR family transcriptional regulator [Sphingomonas morindae]
METGNPLGTPSSPATSDVRAELINALHRSLATAPGQATIRLMLARRLLAGRQRRAMMIPGVSFGEPAWDILLDLYVAAREHRRVSVSDACIAAQVPPTTAVRWIKRLEAQGAVVRHPDPDDRRRWFVSLSVALLASVDQWLDAEWQSLSKMQA